MRWREVPWFYARLGGLLAGSALSRLGPCLPDGLIELAGGLLAPMATFLPEPLRAGWALAMAHDGRQEPPVLLVPGFMGPSFLLVPLAAFLGAHGREVEILATFPALRGVEASTRRVAHAIQALKERTGAPCVDLVAHSMGGLACRHYMNHHMGERDVRRFISIATPHLGTRWAHLPFSRSAADMRPGNAFLSALAERPPAPGVRCYTIRAGWDQIVWPREHGRWDGHARDHELPWAEHWAVQVDPRTLALVLALLEEPDAELDRGVPGEAGATSSPAPAPAAPPPRG